MSDRCRALHPTLSKHYGISGQYCQCTKPPGHRGPHWCGCCGAQWHDKWAVSGRTVTTRNRLEQQP
jgi:hypothetical protein